MNGLEVVIGVVIVVIHTLLVVTQTALVSSVPSRLAERSAESSASARRLAADPHATILGLQTATALCSVALGVCVVLGPSSVVGFVVAAAALLVPTLVIPRLAVPSAEGTVVVLAPFVGPLVRLVAPLSRGIGAMAGRRRHVVTVDGAELESILDESRDIGLIDADDHELIATVLAFEARTAAEVMVPVNDVVTTRRGDTVHNAEGAIAASGHSRLLVIGDSVNDVLGFVHAKDLMALPQARRERPIPYDVVRMILTATPTTPLGDLFASMRRARRHVVVIVDESGATLGMVTMEDILEAIVGEIIDESDRERR